MPPRMRLAEKLRAQRAAAEKLAEQRVQAARDRAEGKTPPIRAPQPPRAAAPTPRTPHCGAAPDPARPSAACRRPPQVQLCR